MPILTATRDRWEALSQSPWCIHGILALGFLTRLIPYFRNRALWYDEAMLALNIVNRSQAELLRPLDYDQGAPFGFLLVEKGLVELLGNSEFALRLFPLVSGLVLLVLFARLASLLLPPRAALLAVLLCAVNPRLSYYASEVKPYSSDALVAVVLLLLFCQAHMSGWNGRRFLLLGGAGLVAVWFSFPSVFILAGLGISLAVWLLWRRQWSLLVWLTAMACLWLGSFGLYYAIALRDLAGNDVQAAYWADSFMPLLPVTLQDWWWFPDHFRDLFSHPGGVPGIGMVAFVLGVRSCLHRNRFTAAILLAPLLLTLLASGLHLYPFRGRVLLFLAPLLLVLIAAGAEQVRTSPSPRWWRLTFPIALLGTVLAAWLWYGFKPCHMAQFREVMAYVRQHHWAGDRFYATRMSRPAFDYYAAQYALPPILQRERAGAPPYGVDASELAPFRGQPRVWIIFGMSRGDEERAFQSLADQLGVRVQSFRRGATTVHLYDFSEADDGQRCE